MLEIRLTPFNPGPQNVPNVTPATPNQTSTQVPPSLAVIPPGALLKGFVLNRDSSGNPVLRTPQGDFVVQSTIFLRIGSDVTVQVDATGKNFRAHLVLVDGQPPGASQQKTESSINDPVVRSPLNVSGGTESGKTAQTALNLAQATPRPVFSGTLLAPSPAFTQASSTLSGNNALPQITQLNLQLVETVLPLPMAAQALLKKTITPEPDGEIPINSATDTADADAPDNPPLTARNPASKPAGKYAAYGNPSFTPSPSAPSTPLLSAAQHAQAVEAIQAFLKSPQQNPLPLLANVVGLEPTGEPLLSSLFGLIRLNTTSPIPNGTQLNFNVSLPTETQAVTQPVSDPLEAALISGKWPALQAILSALRNTNQTGMLALLLLQLPSVFSTQTTANAQTKPPFFSKSLMAFFSALKSGDATQVLPQRVMQALESSGLGHLTKAFTQEFAQMHQAYTDSLNQPWQSFYFPLLNDAQAQMARFYFRRGKKQSSGEDDSTPQDYSRFVVEIEPSALGGMQLDGLVHWQEGSVNNTRFDLIIRTHTALPQEAYNDIISIYHQTGELTGYHGKIQFQVGAEFPMHPLDNHESGHEGVVV